MSEMSVQMGKQLYEAMRELLDEREMEYEAEQEEDDNHVVVFNYRGEDTTHRMIIRINGDRGLVHFSERLNFTVEEPAVVRVIDACNRINNSILYGTFYFDYEDQVVRFYNPLLFNNSIVSKETMNEMLLRSVSIIEDFDDRLAAVNKGYLPSDKILLDEEEE